MSKWLEEVVQWKLMAQVYYILITLIIIILYYIIIYYYYIVPICLLIVYEPTANFGNQGNVQITDNWRIRRLLGNAWFPITISIQVPCDGVFVVIFFKTMYKNNNCFYAFGFCDILNNQGLGKCYPPRPSAWLITLASTLIILDITKNSSNICL